MTAPEVAALETADATKEGAAIQESAKTFADIIASGMKVDEKPSVTVQTDSTQAPAPDAAAAAATTTETVVEEPITVEELTEVEKVLDELGIDLGMKAADVPEALRPTYERLVQGAVALAEDSLTRQLQASDTMRQFEDFKQTLESSPDRLLLSIAVSHPELIEQANQLVAEMKADPRVKDTVMREVQVELKLREADRKEKLMDERDRRMKAQQVIAATRRASREHNVDFALAEKFVAMAVKANGGNLDPQDVQDIVKGMKSEAAKPRPRVVTPAAAAATKAAPVSVAGAQGNQVPLSKGLESDLKGRDKSGGRFRGIVKDAMARLAGGGQQ